jgi:two-component system response regulator DevR
MSVGVRSDALRLVIVDDHPAAREGLRLRLHREPDLLIVGEAATARDAIAEVTRLRPDVVVVDMSLPDGDGIDLVRDLGSVHPHMRSIVLTLNDAPHHRERARQNGARAFVGKQEPTQVLLQAIRGVDHTA